MIVPDMKRDGRAFARRSIIGADLLQDASARRRDKPCHDRIEISRSPSRLIRPVCWKANIRGSQSRKWRVAARPLRTFSLTLNATILYFAAPIVSARSYNG